MGEGDDGEWARVTMVQASTPFRHSLRKQGIQKYSQPRIITVANASGSERKLWIRARTAFHGSLILNDGSKRNTTHPPQWDGLRAINTG